MPEPFLVSAEPTGDGKLQLAWMVPEMDTRGILIAVAEDTEFTVNRRIFVTPITSQAILSVGAGSWYVRVGVAYGSPEKGAIGWSGIHGPIPCVATTAATATTATIASLPTSSPPPSSSLTILHSKPVEGGYRFHTGKTDPHIVLFEMGKVADVGTRFPAGSTRWKWVAEKGYMGWTDCEGLNYPESYAIRISSFDGSAFPTDRVILLGPGRVFPRVVCARTPFYKDFAEKQNARGDAILLNSRKVDPNLKFTSHSEYLRYQAAMVRSGDDKARTVGPKHFSATEHEA